MISVTSLLWIWKGSDAAGRWYFITIPDEQSDEIRAHAFGNPRPIPEASILRVEQHHVAVHRSGGASGLLQQHQRQEPSGLRLRQQVHEQASQTNGLAGQIVTCQRRA